MQLDPEGEVDGHAALVAHDLDVFGLDALLHAELDGESFGFERTMLFVGLPLLDTVGHGGREVVEPADGRVDRFGGAQNLLLFGDVFLHGSVCDSDFMFRVCVRCGTVRAHRRGSGGAEVPAKRRGGGHSISKVRAVGLSVVMRTRIVLSGSSPSIFSGHSIRQMSPE